MEKQQLKRCPIGIQTFEEIINKDYLYIDKTEYIYRMANGASKYCFLSRPRRFGKSLLTSTLHSYFAGKKDLFEGLAIEKLETEWTEYPVLHFDMSLSKHVDKETLESMLDVQLFEHEKIYGNPERAVTLNDRMKTLIMRACEQTDRQVVVLIDEYDAPLLDVMHEEENLPVLRNVIRNFYSPLKACDPYLRFVFLTGITKFSQLSIFSELNNISNVSMDEPYAAVCGITEEEMLERMLGHIECLAGALEMTCEETRLKLKEKYDGYHFTWPSPDIYNPFSLLNALERKKIDNYWFGSGTPTYLVEMLRKFHVLPSEVGHSMQAMASDFDAPTEKMESIVPLLYQSGYLTIKGYDEEFGMYRLGFPNREVEEGVVRFLLPFYANVNKVESGVRLRYNWKNPNTGIVEEILIECTETRDQPKNKERALSRLRTFIYDKEHQKYIDDIASKRKTMVSTGDRSAKIRTYNYPQGRITDHRINYTIYNLAAFMDGDIQDCIDHLTVAENAERLKESEL